MKYWFIFILSFFALVSTQAHPIPWKYHLFLKFASNVSHDNNLLYEKFVTDSVRMIEVYDSLSIELNKLGYLNLERKITFNSVDSIWDVCLEVLQKYNVLNIRKSYVFYSNDSFEIENINNEIKTLNIASLLSQKVDGFISQGFLFASAKLDSIDITNDKVNAVMNIKPGKLIKWDLPEISDNSLLNKYYLAHLLGIIPGRQSNISVLNKLPKIMDDLHSLRLISNPQLIFVGDKVKLLVRLESLKSSSFQGMLAYVSNNNTNAYLTGDAKIDLKNLFKRNIELDMQFRSFQRTSSDFQLTIAKPYFHFLQCGLAYSLALYRSDSSFIDVSNEWSLISRPGSNWRFKYTIKNQQSSLLYIDTNAIKQNAKLPNYLDFSANSLGVEVMYKKLNNINSPRNGSILISSFQIGQKHIYVNNSINSLVFEKNAIQYHLYDSIQLKQLQAKVNISLETYYTVFKNICFHLKHSMAWIESPLILQTEMYRLGGANSLKGFSEQSILAEKYGLSILECRYYINYSSYFSLTWNGGYTENSRIGAFQQKIFQGLAAGFSLPTSNGIFNMFYAIGKNDNETWSTNASKIHFGYIATF